MPGILGDIGTVMQAVGGASLRKDPRAMQDYYQNLTRETDRRAFQEELDASGIPQDPFNFDYLGMLLKHGQITAKEVSTLLAEKARMDMTGKHHEENLGQRKEEFGAEQKYRGQRLGEDVRQFDTTQDFRNRQLEETERYHDRMAGVAETRAAQAGGTTSKDWERIAHNDLARRLGYNQMSGLTGEKAKQYAIGSRMLMEFQARGMDPYDAANLAWESVVGMNRQEYGTGIQPGAAPVNPELAVPPELRGGGQGGAGIEGQLRGRPPGRYRVDGQIISWDGERVL